MMKKALEVFIYQSLEFRKTNLYPISEGSSGQPVIIIPFKRSPKVFLPSDRIILL